MREIGHKFARLESLRSAGFPVPDFFCLPAAEFDRAFGGLRSALPPVSSVPVADWCASAASALSKAVPEGECAARLLDAFDEHVGAEGTAAVRACVVPGVDGGGEDSADDPFAGMSDSFLYVRRDGLLEAVARCWASAFKAEAVQYRIVKGVDPAGVRVAVGVQRMVPGTRSFVAFTRDPRDGTRHHVIAAAHGIGEGVVQEKADVDHYFVDPKTGTVRAEVVVKRRMVGPPADGATDLRVTEVPDALRDAPVLSDEQAQEVADLAARVEERFGCPQDIEGTFTPDGAVHLVQARPLAGDPPDTGPRVHWGNHNITESFPGVSGALAYSQARMFYELAFTDLYRRMGVPDRRLRANAHRLPRMVGHLDGRVYYRLDDWQELHGQLPAFDLVRAGWEEGMGITGEVRAPRRRPRARVAAARAAIALAERAAEIPDLKTALLALDGTDGDGAEEERLRALWVDIAAGRYGSPMAAATRAYLRRYGDRAMHDLKLDEPTPRQRPWTVLATIAPFVRQGATVAGNRAAAERAAAEARRRLRAACRDPLRRCALTALVSLMRWLVRTREDARFIRTQLFGLSREVLWRLGRRARGPARAGVERRDRPRPGQDRPGSGDRARRLRGPDPHRPGHRPGLAPAHDRRVRAGRRARHLLSHTAVTGRLLGVPAAVAVGGATGRIPDGAWIELDGRAGTVRLLDAPAAPAARAR